MITVVIVDDSTVARAHLRRTLEADSELLVVGEATNGLEAMRLINRYDPRLITMDVFLRDENGLDITAAIMSESPRPIIVMTGVNPSDPELVYKALDRGALEVTSKLPARQSPEFAAAANRLIRLVKALSQVPVATRWTRKSRLAAIRQTRHIAPVSQALQCQSSRPGQMEHIANPEVFLFGASTGGPPVLNRILSSLQTPIPIPVVVSQHMSAGFGVGFGQWLEQVTGLRCVLVQDRTRLAPNTVYVAPDSQNLVFLSERYATVETPSPTDRIVPSITAMFESGARHFGDAAVGVLLTGMGKDGAQGLKAIKTADGTTLVQAPETCVVSSMPETALSLKAADAALQPDQIARALNRLLTQRRI